MPAPSPYKLNAQQAHERCVALNRAMAAEAPRVPCGGTHTSTCKIVEPPFCTAHDELFRRLIAVTR